MAPCAIRLARLGLSVLDPSRRFFEGQRHAGRIDEPRLSVCAWLDPEVQPPVVEKRRGKQLVAAPELGFALSWRLGAGDDHTDRGHHAATIFMEGFLSSQGRRAPVSTSLTTWAPSSGDTGLSRTRAAIWSSLLVLLERVE